MKPSQPESRNTFTASNLTRHPKKRRPRGDLRVSNVECLEPRLLLYSANGGEWTHPELVTVSFMPDGTDVGGTPSNLFSRMNAASSTPTWQKEILRGLQSFAANANLNFSVVADDGSPFGSSGFSGTDNNMQGDRNFGDIRIGGLDLGSYLGIGLLPMPINQDTTAGDFFLNTNKAWNIGSTFDVHTVAAHEAGHGIGLSHASLSNAVMYSTYNSVKPALTSDDIAGIQSLYGSRYADGFDAWSPNESKASARDINAYVDVNKQLTITGVDITTDRDVDWYKFTTPTGSAGSMEVRVQSTGFSLLAPKFTLYKGSNNKGTVSGSYHSTVSQVESISSGQNWFVKVEAAELGVFGTGGYALQVNMGSSVLPGVVLPKTATAAVGGGGSSEGISTGCSGLLGCLVSTATQTLTGGLNTLLNLVAQGKAEVIGTEPHDDAHHVSHHSAIETTEDHDVHEAMDHWESVITTDDGGAPANHDSQADGASFDDCDDGSSRGGQRDRIQKARRRIAATLDDIADNDRFDVVRPKIDLVCDLIEQWR